MKVKKSLTGNLNIIGDTEMIISQYFYKPFWTYAETADFLNLSVSTIYTYVWARKLIPEKRKGLRPVFRRDYILSLFPENKNAASELVLHEAAASSSLLLTNTSNDNIMIKHEGVDVKTEV